LREKICVVCGAWFDTPSSAKICSDECRDERKADRLQQPEAKFVQLERQLDKEKIYWRDDRLMHNLHFYSALLAWNECQYCAGPLGTGVGLDRLDNTVGHRSNNIAAICCGICNGVRSDVFTVEDMALLRPALIQIRLRREARIAGSAT
jgi:hypothetical protein